MHDDCPSNEKLKTILDRVDQIWHIIAESTTSEGSILDRLRKQAAQIEELQKAVEKVRGTALWDHCVKSTAGAVCQALVAFLFLMLVRGVLFEIARGIPR